MPDRKTFSMEAQNRTNSKTPGQAGIEMKRLFISEAEQQPLVNGRMLAMDLDSGYMGVDTGSGWQPVPANLP